MQHTDMSSGLENCTDVQMARIHVHSGATRTTAEVSTYQLEAQYFASTSQNDPGTIRMCQVHAQSSDMPTDTSEPVGTPKTAQSAILT